jgi:VRR-NUC domain.
VEQRDKLTPVENLALDKLDTQFDEVIRCTPNAIDGFSERFPSLADRVSSRAQRHGVELGNVFRPGVPDFLGVQETGEYLFVEVKGAGDGLRHSQLKWLRDFRDLEVEVWFVDSNDGATERMNSSRLDAYSLKDKTGTGSEVVEVESGLAVQIPGSLAASVQLSAGDKADWSVVDSSTLELDT